MGLRLLLALNEKLTTPRIRNYDLVLATSLMVYGLLHLQGHRGGLTMALRLLLWGVLFVAPWISAWLAPRNDPSRLDRLLVSLILMLILGLLPFVPAVSTGKEVAEGPTTGDGVS